jgi:predicted ATP-grasp superfamily ATP-dependent carboligase
MSCFLRILVYEHTSGGGFAGEQLPTSILPEGFGMLRCLSSDLSRAGHRTVTLIDSRLLGGVSLLEVEQITPISSRDQLTKLFPKTLESVDAAYIIAPEMDRTLEALVRKMEESGVLSLNCSADAIHTSTDKATSLRILKGAGFRVPKTTIIDLDEGPEEMIRQEIGSGARLILKPLRGGGSSGLSVVTDENEVRMALDKIKATTTESLVVMQELVQGVAASVNSIRTSEAVIPLTLNQQFVRIAPPSSDSAYLGGLVPLQHHLKDQALDAAARATDAFPGLTGYVGIDMVLTEEGPVIIEVNPRLTTSYIGARRVLKVNLGQSIVQAASFRELPQQVDPSGYAVFYKVPRGWVPPEEFRKEPMRLDVISPPVQTKENADSLVLVYTETLAMATRAHSLLAEAEK